MRGCKASGRSLQWLLLVILSLGHLLTDLVGGALPVLLPVLREEFALSYTSLGAIVLVSNLSASVVQPLFGIWSDRRSIRWLLPVGCIVSALGMAMAGVAPTYLLILVGIALSGIGTAAYHPEASKQAFLIGGEKKATALSIYSVGGNVGFGLGPLFATFLLDLSGRKGMVGLLIPALIIALLANWSLPSLRRLADQRASIPEKTSNQGLKSELTRGVVFSLFLLVMIVILRSFIHIGLTNFIPLYVVDHLHGDSHFAALLVSVFLLSGAVGTIFGGPIADRFGRKKVIMLSFLLIIPSLWLFLLHSSGIWSLLLAAWSGFILISTFAVTIVYAQEMLPHHVGLASGLILGFAFGVGALGGLAFGAAADAWGIPAVLKVVCLLPIPAFLLALALPDQEPRSKGGALS